VQAYVAGFGAGARHADPKITVLNGYVHSFLDDQGCEHVANKQIAHGSQVVFAVAGPGGMGALSAAKRKGVYGVGVDTDQSGLGNFILTSVVINWSLAVYDLARRLVDGRLPTGGNLSFGLRNDGVSLGKFSPKVPPTLIRQLRPLRAQIEQGKIVVPTAVNARW
jgi:basic membrane protein A